jgi:hypothetical protein
MKSFHLIYGLSASEPVVTKSNGNKEVLWGFQFFEQMTNLFVVTYNDTDIYKLYEGSIDNVIIEGEYFDVIKKLNEGFIPFSEMEQKKLAGKFI